ncbi:glycoside hydrolase family 32 protein [Paenibacillus sp. LHD-117]|uniref:glycoside hydrolase family 32 protein n=1 Tax=Paenibacillus sp. LHD-117 TaxID=3071412 RepID=UPI0027DF8ACA|nr:glycoside hydrolase family 32 protein [Paenibacillus sp. LHD-117]MDQ6420301.1 glycoside hydrolase family 32 protein [Paenibacillus sp. LHD-117]
MAVRKKRTVACLLGAAAIMALSACSNGANGPGESRQETPQASIAPSQKPAESAVPGEAEAMAPSDRLFWKPPAGWVGDLMPYNDGTDKLHLFYLQDWRDGAPGFHPWHQVTTTTLTDYADEGESIPVGLEHEPDLAIGTGSVIKEGNTYHAFYTGHNWKFPDQGKPKEAMMHAVSQDLKTWTKLPEHTFVAPEGYEIHDFRDPFVLYNEEAGVYWMLVSARKEGVGGVIAKFVSKDLERWEVSEPLEVEASSSFFMLECPDVFRIGDKWYLVFSEFSDKKATHYRVSDSLEGPWLLPKDGDDLFDGRAFYAAKTGMLGDERFLYGWVPTRQMEKDFMKWDWAGNLVPHQIVAHEDGTLGVKPPDQLADYLSKPEEMKMERTLGTATGSGGEWKLDGESGLAGVVFDKLPQIAKLTGKFRFEEGTQFTGFVASVGEDAEKAYGIQAEPGKSRIRYDAVQGEALTTVEPDVSVSVPFRAGTEYPFTLLIEDDVAVFYVDDYALTTRIYKMPGGNWGWYARGGAVTLSELALFTPKED